MVRRFGDVRSRNGYLGWWKSGTVFQSKSSWIECIGDILVSRVVVAMWWWTSLCSVLARWTYLSKTFALQLAKERQCGEEEQCSFGWSLVGWIQSTMWFLPEGSFLTFSLLAILLRADWQRSGQSWRLRKCRWETSLYLGWLWWCVRSIEDSWTFTMQTIQMVPRQYLSGTIHSRWKSLLWRGILSMHDRSIQRNVRSLL